MRYTVLVKKIYLITIGVIGLIVGLVFLTKNTQLEPQPLRRGPIIAIGDSLVYGYGATPGNDFVSILSREINQPITNLGIVRETTFDIRARLDQDVVAKAPALTIVLVGGNDFLRRIPKTETLENIEAIVVALKQSGSEVLLLGVNTMVYSKDYQKIALRHGAQFVPGVLDGIIGVPELMSDAVHPNDAGYAKVAEKITPVLQTIINVEL